MFVKAIKQGFYDTAKTGGFMEIKVGTVFEVPDDFKAAWVVECDEKGRVIQVDALTKNLDALLAKANAAEADARMSADRAKAARAAYEAEKKRVDELAAEQAKNPKKADGKKGAPAKAPEPTKTTEPAKAPEQPKP